MTIDNLSNSKHKVIYRIDMITDKRPSFVEGDIHDRTVIQETFGSYLVAAGQHFTGLKAVGESEKESYKDIDNNVTRSAVLFDEMANADVLGYIAMAVQQVSRAMGSSATHQDGP